MEAKELMIGDWIMFFDKEWKPNRIRGLNPDVNYPLNIGIEEYEYTTNECFIQPIPLTEEILKANVLDPNTYCDLSMPKWFMSIRSRNNHVEMPFRYVHELQHALRLCGLNELADNFKV